MEPTVGGACDGVNRRCDIGIRQGRADRAGRDSAARQQRPADAGGLYQSVYQAVSSASDATLSDITASDLALGRLLSDIAGFASGVDGDGVLAFVLFEYLPGQVGQDPGFEIVDPTGGGTASAPGSPALAVAGLAGLVLLRRRVRQC